MKKFALFLFIALVALAFALPASACNYHAYYDCSGSAVYWFNSCGNREDLKVDCLPLGQTCQYGQCVAIQQPVKPIQPVKPAVPTTLATPTQPVTPETPAVANTSLFVSLFGKKDPSATQWDKSVEIGSNGTVYFLITITNSSDKQIDNANASAVIPAEIYSVGNLKINDVPSQGDITLGVSVGPLKSNTTESITFEGKTQQLSATSAQQASVKITTPAGMQSDSISINFNPQTASQPVASVSSASSASFIAPGWFWGFLSHWYSWIIIAIVMIFLFIVVFKRLSKNAQ